MMGGLYESVRNTWRFPVNFIANKLSHPVLILMYHRVTNLSSDPQFLAVSPDNFRTHMQQIAKYPVLRFEEEWSNSTAPAIVITFDDGYADNVLQALPILEEFNIPATFFVNTGNIDSDREFWWDEIERLIFGVGPRPASIYLRLHNVPTSFRRWPTMTENERKRLYSDVHRYIMKVGDYSGIFEQLLQWSGATTAGRVTHRSMTSAELRRAATSQLVTIGAHGVSHLPLSSLSFERQLEEMAESRARLEACAGKPVSVFSYPFGTKRDYTEKTISLLKSSGFIKAAANFPGQWHPWADPFQIPRVIVRNWNETEFIRQLRYFWTC